MRQKKTLSRGPEPNTYWRRRTEDAIDTAIQSPPEVIVQGLLAIVEAIEELTAAVKLTKT